MNLFFFVLIYLLKNLNCQYWYQVASNLQNGFTQTDGWSTQNTVNCNTSYCNSQEILGGSYCFQDQTKASQTFSNLPQHYQVKIDFTLWLLGLDHYWGDQVTVTLGSTAQTFKPAYSNQNYICVSYQDQTNQGTITTQDSNSSISVVFQGQVYYQYDSQGWGISDFSLSVQLCNPTCQICNGVEAYSCTSCWNNASLVIYQGSLGFCQCNPGYYAVTGNVPCLNPPCSTCNQCDSSCATCTAGDKFSCVNCPTNYYKQYYGSDLVNNTDPRYQKSMCQTTCFATNYYQDTSTQSCLKCADSCLTCNGQLDSNCLTCPPNYYLDGQSFGYCVQTCSSSYYKDDLTMKCLKCNTNCLECTQNQPNFCSQCVDGNYLTIGTGLCVSDCGQGQWGNNTNWTCQLCDSSCYTCSQSATNCTSCIGTLYLFQNQCLSVCPDGYYKEINNTCQQCDPSCKTCDNAGNTSCLSCSPSYGYLKNRMCIQCPIQFYGDTANQTCQPCDSSCYSCDAGTPSDCLSCSTNFLQNRQCIPICNGGYWGNSQTHTCDQCDSNCLTCQPQGPSTSCLSCSSPLFLKNYACITTCNPIGEYGDQITRKCTLCDISCNTCDLQSSNCLSCTGSLQFYQNTCLSVCPQHYYGFNNVCQKQCPNSMYPDDNTNLCQPCNPICPTCFGQTISECYSCLAPYYLDVNTCVLQCPSNKYKNNQNQECNICDSSCLTCDGGSNQNCTSCSPTLYFGNNQCFSYCLAPYFSSTVNMQCVLNCPGGYWGDTNSPQRMCQKCHPQCQLCYGGTFAQCTQCSVNYYLFQNTCDNCPVNYFPNTNTGNCDNCFQTCQSCNGPSSSNCLSCNTGYFYLPDTQTCYSICPIPYFSHFTQPNCLLSCPTSYIQPLYGDPQSRKCLNCDVSCQKCSGPTNLNCISCAQGYYSYNQNKSCVLTCPDGTYADIQSMQCLPCDQACATCNGGSSTSCLSCLLPSVLFNSQCIQDCPNSLYKDLDLKQCVSDCTAKFPNKYSSQSDMTCQYCNPYCQQCTGPLSTQCITCKNPYLKFNTSCLSQCQKGTYFDSQKVNSNDNDCKQCDPACLDCYGPASNNCVTCNPNLYTLQQNGATLCILDCPDLYIKDSQKMTCSTCPQKTYFVQGQCQKCHYSCQSCFGSYQNQCLACMSTRGSDSSNNPSFGICSCQSGYIESYQSYCDLMPQNVVVATKATYAFAISGTTTSILIGILGRNMFFIYNILEVAQFTSFFKYVNINFPLGLQSIFEKLYISQISSIVDLNPSPPSSSKTNSTQSNNTTKNRILEWNQYQNSDIIFEIQGNNSPLWQSFFFLILLNILSLVFVLGLNVLVNNWRIKYNQAFLIEKIRCWSTYGLPIQTFLRTSMEAILFIVLCFKQAQDLSALDWIFCLYFLIALLSIIIVMIYQNIQPLELDAENQGVIQILKLKKNKVNDEQAQIEKSYQSYPHPYRTLWQFTKTDKISRNYFVINIVSKIFVVTLTVELVSDPSKQILAIAVIKTIYFLLVLLIRPMVNYVFNSFLILNELLQTAICYLIFKISASSKEDQNSYGYAVLILILILFLLNLIGSLVSLTIIVKKLFNLYVNKAQNLKIEQTSKDNQRIKNLNKSQQIDMHNNDYEVRQKKISQNIIDNSSTVQIQRDALDDFDQSKTIQNQSVFQYDYENPFQFLDISASDRQNNQRKKKSKKINQLKQNNPDIKKNEQDNSQFNKDGDNQIDDFDLSKLDNTEINHNKNEQKLFYMKQSMSDNVKNKKKFSQDDIKNMQYSTQHEQQNQNKQKEYQKQKLNEQQEQLQQQDQHNCKISQNQKEFRERNNQNSEDLSDYALKANVLSQTPLSQFISFTPNQNINKTHIDDIDNHFQLENTSINNEYQLQQKSPLNLFPIQKPQQAGDLKNLDGLENTNQLKMAISQQIKNQQKFNDKACGDLEHLQEIDLQKIQGSPLTKQEQDLNMNQDFQITGNLQKIDDFLDTDLLSINKSLFMKKIPSQSLMKQDTQFVDNFQILYQDKHQQQQIKTPQTNKKIQQLQIKYDKKPNTDNQEIFEHLNIKQEEEDSNNQPSFINNLTKQKKRKTQGIMKRDMIEDKEQDNSQNKTSFINNITKTKQKKKRILQLTVNDD